jgi:hypothetical protein
VKGVLEGTGQLRGCVKRGRPSLTDKNTDALIGDVVCACVCQWEMRVSGGVERPAASATCTVAAPAPDAVFHRTIYGSTRHVVL